MESTDHEYHQTTHKDKNTAMASQRGCTETTLTRNLRDVSDVTPEFTSFQWCVWKKKETRLSLRLWFIAQHVRAIQASSEMFSFMPGWIANTITWSSTSLILCLQHIQSLVRALRVAHLANKHNFYSFTPLFFSHTAVNLDCELRVGGNFSEKAPTLSQAGKSCIYKKRQWGFSPDYTNFFFSSVNSEFVLLSLTEGLSDSSITRLFYY